MQFLINAFETQFLNSFDVGAENNNYIQKLGCTCLESDKKVLRKQDKQLVSRETKQIVSFRFSNVKDTMVTKNKVCAWLSCLDIEKSERGVLKTKQI